MGKYNQESVKALFEKEGFSVLGEYVNYHKPILVKCHLGHETKKRLSNLLSHGGGCSLCRYESVSKKLRTPFEDIEKIAKEKGVVLITNRSFYEQNHHKTLKLEFKCFCGRIQKKTVNRFNSWKKCSYCQNTAHSPELANISLIAKYIEKNGFTLISDKYNNNKSTLVINCKEHGNWNANWSNIKNGHWCRFCAGKKRAIPKLTSIQTIEQKLTEIDYKLISTEYIGSKKELIVQCPKGHEWSTIWNSIDQGQRCPRCSKKVSYPHAEIIDFIKDIYKDSVITNNRTVLDGLELDILIPELNLGIEFDGLFWHSEYFDDSDRIKAKNKNIRKIKAVQNSKINFLAFYEDEWKNKQHIVKSMIKNKLRLITNKIYARNTGFVKITNKEAKKFLDANHIDGYVKSTDSFGLKYQNELVMVMTFRKTMRGENEIARMATLIDHVVIGGASKLLKNAPKPLITYSNNRFSNGDVYSKLGFEEITETFQPSYYYTDFKKRVFRTKCMKIQDLPGTEREQALSGAFSKHFGHDNPVYRIYDYGHRKWLKKS